MRVHMHGTNSNALNGGSIASHWHPVIASIIINNDRMETPFRHDTMSAAETTTESFDLQQ
jgi:hypothetical protein